MFDNAKRFVRFLKRKAKLCFFYLLTIISPKLNTQAHFIIEKGKIANLKNPKTFSEKISWLKLNNYSTSPLVRQCSDKLLVREYVKENGFANLLNDLLGVYNSVDEIKWEQLPNQFALKWNFGSGLNYICADKSAVAFENVKKILERMGKSKYWLEYAESQYKTKQKRILCERYLFVKEGEPLTDYKFYCFSGNARAILVISRFNQKAEHAAFMSPNWEYMSDIPERYKSDFQPMCPPHFEIMLSAAEKLSARFPFVRMDFFDLPDGPVFGEMTFTPMAGISPSETTVDGKTMGELLQLKQS